MLDETRRVETPPVSSPQENPFWAWLIYVVYCIEISLVLILAPWSQIWDGNYFFRSCELLKPWIFSGYTRGSVSAFGAILLWMGLESLYQKFREHFLRRSADKNT